MLHPSMGIIIETERRKQYVEIIGENGLVVLTEFQYANSIILAIVDFKENARIEMFIFS